MMQAPAEKLGQNDLWVSIFSETWLHFVFSGSQHLISWFTLLAWCLLLHNILLCLESVGDKRNVISCVYAVCDLFLRPKVKLLLNDCIIFLVLIVKSGEKLTSYCKILIWKKKSFNVVRNLTASICIVRICRVKIHTSLNWAFIKHASAGNRTICTLWHFTLTFTPKDSICCCS